MPVEYLAYLNIILLTRLVYLVKDRALSASGNLALALIQGLICLALFQWSAALWAMLCAVVIFTGFGWFVERRRDGTAGMRLISLVGLTLLPGLFFQDQYHHGFSTWVYSLKNGILAGLPLLGDGVFDTRATAVLFGLLVTGNETNILMRVILHYCNLEPHVGETAAVDEAQFRAGRIIGVLERWLILFIVLYESDLNAIGFIVAAKGLVRFKKLQDQSFAEYLLVGTLLSVLAAVLTGSWVAAMNPA